MKKKVFLPVVGFVMAMASAAFAQQALPPLQGSIPTLVEVQAPKPTLTSPFTIMLVYYKLTARAPDLEALAKQQDVYKNAPVFNQPATLESSVKKLTAAYNLLQLSEPLLMETQVTISPYDAKNLGFSVESFKPETFFPASYGGQNYAIVPEDIMDKQWLKVEDAAVAASIEKVAAANNRVLTMVLWLVPRYADAKNSAVIDGETYWPIVANVKKMALYTPSGDTTLWQSTDVSVSDKNRQNLLNLYQ